MNYEFMIKFCYRYCSPHFIELRAIWREFEILKFKIRLGTENLEHVHIDEKIEGRFGEHLQQTLEGGGGALNLKKLRKLLMFLIA